MRHRCKKHGPIRDHYPPRSSGTALGRWALLGLAALTLTACGRAAPAASPPANDWHTTFRGSGGLLVHVKTTATVPLFVRVRDKKTLATAAQVPVPPGTTETFQLPAGDFEILLRIESAEGPHHYQGPAVPVPEGAHGNATLIVGEGLGAQGIPVALHEISKAEFER